MQYMIQVRDLHKSYFVARQYRGTFGALRTLFSRSGREVRAVDGLSFCVERGEFVGYVGPNGAGKSTTIKMLTGILHPSSGEALVNGLSPQRRRQDVARRIGVVFGQRTQLWWDLPVLDSFELLAAMYRVDERRYREAIAQFEELLGLDDFLDQPVRKLSLGQRMRAEIAAALLHDPDILFLDEPTIGLDLVAKERIRDFLREVNGQGTTIMLTTHDLADVERLCRRIMVINHGRLAFDGTLAQLRASAGAPTILTVEYRAAPAGETELQDLGLTLLEPGRGELSLTVAFDRARHSASQAVAAMSRLGEIADIHLREPDIEQVIGRLY